jgi:hypothetical protein
MEKSQNKTTAKEASVSEFLESISDPIKKQTASFCWI